MVHDSKFILGVDVGTTNIRCYVYDNKANIVGKANEKISIVQGGDGRSEIKPDDLWKSFQNVVKKSIIDANLDSCDVTSLGISTQRGTFVTWDRRNGIPFHNFITWKDKRAALMCDRWNASLKLKMLRFGAWLLYLFSGKQWFLAASRFTLNSAMVLMRLVWVMKNILKISETPNEEILFGTMDTWLLWKLTGGKVHATDPSNASVTGFYDPYQMKWSDTILKMFKIPTGILPVVKSTSDIYGTTLPNIFGFSISINALVGDQQSAMFGQCCFNVGDINCTMGTGTFFDINTGSVPSASQNDVYPLVGWVIDGKTTYISECGSSDTGTIITWANSWGLLDEPQQSSKLALSVRDNGGVYFLPPFSKLQTAKDLKKKDQSHACASVFTGLKPDTTRAHLVRAILEAIIFQAYLLYESLVAEGNFFSNRIRICGGVSNNDFLVQILATLLCKTIIRDKNCDSSSLGAAFFAGLSSGVWGSTKELMALPRNQKEFHAQHERFLHYKSTVEKWKCIAASYSA